MLVILGGAIGVLLGIRSAIRKKGDRLDMIQFAAVQGLLFALLGLFLTLAAGWFGIGMTG